jgi:hypothetical protein
MHIRLDEIRPQWAGWNMNDMNTTPHHTAQHRQGKASTYSIDVPDMVAKLITTD